MTFGTDPALPRPGTSKSPDGVGGGFTGQGGLDGDCGWLVSLDCWPCGTRDGQSGSLSCPAWGTEAGSDRSGVVSVDGGGGLPVTGWVS